MTTVPALADDDPLSEPESADLARLEAGIDRARRSFVEAGDALAEVRDRRLYRADYPTFEAYCKSRWGYTPRYGNMLVASAAVVRELGTTVPVAPATESQARELLALPTPEDRRTVWARVVERSAAERVPITARLVRAEADRQYVPSSSSPSEPGPELPAPGDRVRQARHLLDALDLFLAQLARQPEFAAACRRFGHPEPRLDVTDWWPPLTAIRDVVRALTPR